MSLGADHKLLIVLDHGSKFAKDANSPIPISLKDATSAEMRQVGVAQKTLWTWCVECAMELHRVVSDLFPTQNRLIRLVLADCVGRLLQSEWGTQLITHHQLARYLSGVGPASEGDENGASVLSGLTLAVEALTQLTDKQRESEVANEANSSGILEYGSRRIPLGHRKNAEKIGIDSKQNKGSIIVFTAFSNNDEIAEMESDMTEMIQSRNKIIQSLQDCTFAPIDHVKLFIINTYPQGTECKVTSKTLNEVSSVLSSSVVSRPAGDQLISATHSVTIMLYDLVSTTVSGIPMKEEAQQGQSVNYDVELLHPREAHKQLEQLGLVKFDDITGTLMKVAENSAYATTRLSWATPSPKSKWNLFPRTRIALRATPAAVNSRPSVCLTSFLLQGRNVMLEVARIGAAEKFLPNVNHKLISHTLIAHGGRIYIHAIDIARNNVLDSEELQKAAVLRPLTSARITDFCTLIREAMLRPPKPGKETSSLLEGIPCGQARRQLLRLTRYWPLRMDQSFIYNIPKRFEPLLTVLRQPELSTVDVDKCKQVIYQLVSLRDSLDPLTHQKVKTNLLKDPLNREEQLRVGLAELASHMGNYVNHSERHLEVFHMFMQTTGIDRTTNVSVQDVVLSDTVKKKKIHSDVASSISAADARNSSRSSSPIPKKTRKAIYQWKPNETINLYEYLSEKEEKRTKADWRDFVGRIEAGNRPANLYPNLDLSIPSSRGEVQ